MAAQSLAQTIRLQLDTLAEALTAVKVTLIAEQLAAGKTNPQPAPTRSKLYLPKPRLEAVREVSDRQQDLTTVIIDLGQGLDNYLDVMSRMEKAMFKRSIKRQVRSLPTLAEDAQTAIERYVAVADQLLTNEDEATYADSWHPDAEPVTWSVDREIGYLWTPTNQTAVALATFEEIVQALTEEPPYVTTIETVAGVNVAREAGPALTTGICVIGLDNYRKACDQGGRPLPDPKVLEVLEREIENWREQAEAALAKSGPWPILRYRELQDTLRHVPLNLDGRSLGAATLEAGQR